MINIADECANAIRHDVNIEFVIYSGLSHDARYFGDDSLRAINRTGRLLTIKLATDEN